MPAVALTRRRALLTVLALAVALVAWPLSAWAHTEFDSSDPGDGQTVAGPLDRVTVTFTNPATPSGEGFVVLDFSGEPVAPVSVETSDGAAYALVFDPPLESGEYGVRWEVRAGDAHPIDGAFRFVVDSAGGAETGDEGTSSLDEALARDSRDSGALVAGVARAVMIGATLFGLGAVVALGWVVRGRPNELARVLLWVRLAGASVAIGAVVELAMLTQAEPGGLVDVLGASAGVAGLLRLIGGIAVAAGLPARSAATASGGPDEVQDAASGGELVRWAPSWNAAAGIAGFALVLASFWFDGHTVTRGPWALHAAVNLVHLVAGAVWAGGVFVMAALVWRRRRRGLPGDTAWLVIRFSPIAAVSLAAVALAGTVMAVIVLQAPGELWTTEWGRVLLAKIAVVGVAAAMGALNHRRLKPALERDPSSPALARKIRRTLAVESAAFVGVVTLTAWLVAAAT